MLSPEWYDLGDCVEKARGVSALALVLRLILTACTMLASIVTEVPHVWAVFNGHLKGFELAYVCCFLHARLQNWKTRMILIIPSWLTLRIENVATISILPTWTEQRRWSSARRVLLVTSNVYWHHSCNSEAAGRWANAPWGSIRAERISEVRGTWTCLKLSEAVEMKWSRSLTTSVASDRLFLLSDAPKVPPNTLIILSFPTMFKLNPLK